MTVDPVYRTPAPAPAPEPPAAHATAAALAAAAVPPPPVQPRVLSRFDDGIESDDDEEEAEVADPRSAAAAPAPAPAKAAAAPAAAPPKPQADKAEVRVEGVADCVRLVRRLVGILGGTRPASQAALQVGEKEGGRRIGAGAVRLGAGSSQL